MADLKIPYVPSYGVIGKVLNKIKEAPAPERFTQDFLSTKLALKGGTPKPVIPFLKRTGFLASDGAPTERYKRFRNPSESGAAAAEALTQGYTALYEVNEYAHELNDGDLRGLIVQVTGQKPDHSTTNAIFGSFKALKEFADFDALAASPDGQQATAPGVADEVPPQPRGRGVQGIQLGYTINLNLPATSDVAVFNAIFTSLKEHLLR